MSQPKLIFKTNRNQASPSIDPLVLNINGDNNIVSLSINKSSSAIQTNMVMRWHQTNSSPKGNKGIVEAITNDPVKVVFAADDIHQSMIELDRNPFHHAYLVDIDMQTVNGKPALYKVTKLHDIIEV